MSGTLLVWDIGNVLLEWRPERYYDRRIGETRRRALFGEVDLDGTNLAIDGGAAFRDAIHALAEAHPGWRREILWWHDDWLALCAPPIPRSVRLLERCVEKGVPCHALTNFGADTFAMALEAYPFLRRFDAAHVSAHLRLLKPDPAIYAAVEARTGLPPEAHLFVDDRAENVAAAEARGWRAHRFDGPEGWAARLVAEGVLLADEAG